MKTLTYAVVLSCAAVVVSLAQSPDKAAMEAKENAAWQAYKDKSADGFKKVVDKDIKCVYDVGISDMTKEVSDMKTTDIKSFTISDFNMFTDEPDVIVTTYTVKLDASNGGQDMSGTYNAGSVWKKEGSDWLAIFHTNVKQAGATRASSTDPDSTQKKE
jgi:hypothetical protein